MRYLGTLNGHGHLRLSDSMVQGVNYLIDVFMIGREKVALGAIWGDIGQEIDRARGAVTLRLTDGKTLKLLIDKIQNVKGLTQVSIESPIPDC